MMNGHETDGMEGGTGRLPRVALMGEFSAGKSTLSNLLMDSDPLPVRVTATSVPPVWISYGEESATLVGFDGSEKHMEISELSNAALEQTKLVRLTLRADILQMCDLLDMPGISDPNMDFDSWSDIIDQADCVVWCTHATQAWRQSEASSWEEISARTNGDNLLLVTQFDKLKSELDRTRVLARLGKETNGAFKAIFPVSLIEALNAGDDEQAWKLSGADAFIRYLVDLLAATSVEDRPKDTLSFSREPEAEHQSPDLQEADVVATLPETAEEPSLPELQAEGDEIRVLPKRVAAKPGTRSRIRPDASADRHSADSLHSGEAIYGE